MIDRCAIALGIVLARPMTIPRAEAGIADPERESTD